MKLSRGTVQEFCGWFRKNLRDPLLKIAMTNPKIKSYLTVDLPSRLFEAIPRWERNAHMSGQEKAYRLRQEVYTWFNSQGWKALLPFIIPLVEKAVVWLYKDHFMLKFKALGLHEALERALDADLDEDGDVGVDNKKGAASVETTPATLPEPESEPTTSSENCPEPDAPQTDDPPVPATVPPVGVKTRKSQRQK